MYSAEAAIEAPPAVVCVYYVGVCLWRLFISTCPIFVTIAPYCGPMRRLPLKNHLYFIRAVVEVNLEFPLICKVMRTSAPY